jgi:hypothetical protein
VTLLLLALLLALLAAGFVAAPLVARREAVLADLAPGAVLDAQARRRVALAALTELEYDFLGGKVDDADYRAQKDRLSLEALAAIRAAEAAEVGAPRAPRHRCGFLNPPASAFCAGCGARLD